MDQDTLDCTTLRAHQADPAAAAMTRQRFLAGRISPEQAVRAWLEVAC